MSEFHFTFENIKNQYQAALQAGYKFITCEKYYYLRKNKNLPNKCIVNRIDIDLSIKKAEKLGRIFKELEIVGTFFIRLHAPEYNPFSFDNYRIVRQLIRDGNEIGYHSEVIDQSVIWNEDAGVCLERDIDIINKMYDIKIKGVASHGGMTGLNNLDFWKDKKASDFNLLYEAYDTQPEFNLFNESFYLSDSEWTRWKCYNEGKLMGGDRRSLIDHLDDDYKLIYLLIHSDTYFDKHFYE